PHTDTLSLHDALPISPRHIDRQFNTDSRSMLFAMSSRMTGKLQAQQAIAALFLLSIAGMISGLALKTDSQSPSTKSQITKPGNTHTPPTPPKFYEDDEIKVQIPGGWIISSAKGK